MVRELALSMANSCLKFEMLLGKSLKLPTSTLKKYMIFSHYFWKFSYIFFFFLKRARLKTF